MLGITRWHVFKVLAAILCIAGLTWLGMAYLIPAPPSQITIATSPKGEHYHVLGTRYQGIMAESELKVELRETGGAKENLRLLNDPNSGIQIGFMQGGISNSRLAPDLMSLGRIDHQIFWLFSMGDTPIFRSSKASALGSALTAAAIEPCAKKFLPSPA